jgi:Ca-activated chloride channel family protein
VSRQSRTGIFTLALALFVVLPACSGGGGASPTATASPTPAESESAEPSVAEATPTPTPNSGEATLDGPETVESGAEFEVAWTGPDNSGDYITIVPVGATEWTPSNDYFDTLAGSPGELKAPTADGDYLLWYVSGADDSVLAEAAITVTPFTGDLLAPDEVPGGAVFEVAWNGPDGAGDYVTILEANAERWTNEDYFYTGTGSPGELTAPNKAGNYEIRYIAADGTVQATRPITVLEIEASVDGPAEVAVSTQFEVDWTGPNGPGDYVTIVVAGSEPGPNNYGSYFYTNVGNPGTILAPEEPGEYELWYVTGSVYGVYARDPITVTP